jgi:putative hydrolase of the HAD superfamily
VTKKSILFDLGGTLAYFYEPYEFSGILQQAVADVREYLLQKGLLVVSNEEISRRVKEEDHEAKDNHVRPLEERLARIFQLNANVCTDELALEMCRHFMKPIFSRGLCYDDALPTLKGLRSKGYRIGTVSNTSWGSPAILWREELSRLGLSEQLDTAVFCRDVGYRKPARQIFEFTLRKLDASSQDCLFVGDNPKWDLLGPQSVGIAAILIDRQSTNQDADVEKISNLRELADRLSRL